MSTSKENEILNFCLLPVSFVCFLVFSEGR